MTYENAVEAAEFIKSKYDKPLKTALVLGSGLGDFADSLDDAVKLPYSEIPHFARSTVEGHAGRLVLGETAGVPVAVQQGRFHYYEGYAMEQVIFPVRVFGVLGIENLILTNAAGSVQTSYKQGDLVLLRDHINLMGINPLRGANDERFGARFPDMTQIYDTKFQEIAACQANKMARERFESGKTKKLEPLLRRGVYCALSGPTYETPAEIRMLRMLGADVVGMSTVPEAIAARHQGLKVLAMSCVSNLAAGMSDDTIHHEEVMEAGQKVANIFQELLRRIIPRLCH